MVLVDKTQVKVAVEKLGLDWKTFENQGELVVPNNMLTGELYAFCKFEMGPMARSSGMKYDRELKLHYIPKTLSRERVRKLLELEAALYGRHTSTGYMDYKYCVTVPTHLRFVEMTMGGYSIGFENLSDTMHMDDVLNLFDNA